MAAPILPHQVISVYSNAKGLFQHVLEAYLAIIRASGVLFGHSMAARTEEDLKASRLVLPFEPEEIRALITEAYHGRSVVQRACLLYPCLDTHVLQGSDFQTIRP
jgi:hypothetical protein